MPPPHAEVGGKRYGQRAEGAMSVGRQPPPHAEVGSKRRYGRRAEGAMCVGRQSCRARALQGGWRCLTCKVGLHLCVICQLRRGELVVVDLARDAHAAPAPRPSELGPERRPGGEGARVLGTRLRILGLERVRRRERLASGRWLARRNRGDRAVVARRGWRSGGGRVGGGKDAPASPFEASAESFDACSCFFSAALSASRAALCFSSASFSAAKPRSRSAAVRSSASAAAFAASISVTFVSAAVARSSAAAARFFTASTSVPPVA